MIIPDPTVNEDERLLALRSYRVLDTLPEVEYDDLSLLASQICGVPIALISLVDGDRQWFKSAIGFDISETHRDLAFCTHNIIEPTSPLIVNNAQEDKRFQDNPLVTGQPNIVFYAGIPLVNPQGHALGSLCVIDHKPRVLSEAQLQSLQALARQVERLLELRKEVATSRRLNKELSVARENLEEFAQIVAHDLRGPIRRVKQLCEIVDEDHRASLSGDLIDLKDKIEDCAVDGLDMISGVLQYSMGLASLRRAYEWVEVEDVLQEVVRNSPPGTEQMLNWTNQVGSIYTSPLALKQILVNLVGNAIKHSDKAEGTRVEIRVEVLPEQYLFTVCDNGPGIPAELLERVFRKFFSLSQRSRAQGGVGIGLAIVRKLVEAMDGRVWQKNNPEVGCSFYIQLPRIYD